MTWLSPGQPDPCVHDWAHAGVRWWIDATEHPVSWVRYIDQYFCTKCLAMESRPISYHHRLGALPVKEGTFAADDELYGRLGDQARAEYRRRHEITRTSADPPPAAAAAPAARTG